MSLGELRTAQPDRFRRNYQRVVWKESEARENARLQALQPDPRMDTVRSFGAWSQDSQRSSRHSDTDSAREARRRPVTGDALLRSHSMGFAVGGPQRAEVPATFGSGFLGKPCYFDPTADKSLHPKPEPGLRLPCGSDYVPCKAAGNSGIMIWEKGRSHKTAAALQRAQRASSTMGSVGREADGSTSPGALDATTGSAAAAPPMSIGAPVLAPPKPPPWGFGGVPARVRAAHVDFYWGC